MRSTWFDVVSGARRGPAAGAARAALRALSGLYSSASSARRFLYKRNLLRTRSCPLPVISVGNITAGGTGKTPFVEHLSRGLFSRKRKVAVVMRGYGGDEADLLRANLGPDVPVIESPNRYRGALRAKELGAEVVLLDDGFQHLAVARDLDVVLVDATLPFGFGKLLPAGLLRERPEALGRAGAVVITRADLPAPEELACLRRELDRLAPGAVRAEAVYAPKGLVPIVTGGKGTPGSLAHPGGQKVAAFCGIGNPHGFGRVLRKIGMGPVIASRFPDHHRYAPKELAAFQEEALSRGAELVVTTQKDAVRLPRFDWRLPVYFLRGELALTGGVREFWAAVEGVL